MFLKMQYPQHVLLINDTLDPFIDEVVAYFNNCAINITVCHNHGDTIHHLSSKIVDIIILYTPPKIKDALIYNYREYSLALMLVMMAPHDEAEKIIALEANHADMYIDEPVTPRILLAHMCALMRIKYKVYQYTWKKIEKVEHIEKYYQFGDFKLDGTSGVLFGKHKKRVLLTSGEFRLLKILIMNPNQLLSRDRLLTMTKKSYSTCDRSIDTLISRLRQKLNTSCLIRTVRNEGYIMESQVSKVTELSNKIKQIPKFIELENIQPQVLLIINYKSEDTNGILMSLKQAAWKVTILSSPTREDIASFLKKVPTSLIILDTNIRYATSIILHGITIEYSLPIIILLTEYQDFVSKVTLLERGVDYFIHKPVSPRLVLAHANMLMTLRHQPKPTAIIFQLSQWTFFSITYQLISPKNIKVRLNAQLGLLLLILLSQVSGYIFSRQELLTLMENVVNSLNERHIDNLMSKLRKIFNKYDPNANLIRTVRNKGYYLNY